jgi:hypothetical protein
VILWQLRGIGLEAFDLRPLGPSASFAVALAAAFFGIGLVVSVRRWPILFLLSSMVLAILAALTLDNTFRPDVSPDRWLSPAARSCGAAINALGVGAFSISLRASVWGRRRREPAF